MLLDYSRSQLQQAQANLGRSERYIFVAADVYKLPFVHGLFDAATMIRVLHHMAEAPAALEQVRRVLQPQAAFILEYANKQNVKAILRFVLGRQEWSPFSHEPVEFAKLNFDFHPSAIRRWLKERDFAIERQLTVSHYRMALLKRLVPLKLLVAMDAAAQWTGNWWQLSPSVFAKCRATGDSPVAAEGTFFRCPACGCDLAENGKDFLQCPDCGKKWAVRDGIYDFKEPIQ